MNTDNYYKKLTESLKLLSLGFEEQVQFFPAFADAPFEVLDTFDNAFLLLSTLLDEGKIDYGSTANIIRLHNLIAFTSSNPDLKDLDYETFRCSVEWNRIRDLAKETLYLMGELLEAPDPKYI